jgi:hypothetical protein
MKDIDHLGGSTLTAEQLRLVEAEIRIKLPGALASLLATRPLVGLTLRLDSEQDESGLGSEFKWMTAEQMVDEAKNAYPGIVAVPRGFLPVGICLEGSGDPYFIQLQDGSVVRIPHDAVIQGELNSSQVERVAASIQDLINNAEIIGPK